MNITRVVALSASLLSLPVLSAPNVQGQACGRDFVDIMVSAPDGESVQDVTIELIAEVSNEEYRRLESESLAQEDSVNNPDLSSPGHLTALKVTEQVATEIIERSTPMDRAEDFCGNPLKLKSGAIIQTHYGQTREKFGFCTSEGYYHHSFVLKITAPGYETDYYVGPFLGGCHRIYKIVLTKKT